MKFPSIAFLLLVLKFSFILGTQNHPKINPRIIGGEEATIGQFPYQVSLRVIWYNNHFCGGSLISPDIVLSAAHCVFESVFGIKMRIPLFTVTIVAGELRSSPISNPNHERSIQGISVHPEYNQKSFKNDIVLLRLTEPFDLESAIRPIELSSNPSPTPETICQVSGWGNTKQNGTINEELMYVDIPIIEQAVCISLHKIALSNGQICAGELKGGKDSCYGDSGGGLVCSEKLTGIVSLGVGCGLPKLPGIYTNVGYYHSWISKATIELQNSASVSILLIAHCAVCSIVFEIYMRYSSLLAS